MHYFPIYTVLVTLKKILRKGIRAWLEYSRVPTYRAYILDFQSINPLFLDFFLPPDNTWWREFPLFHIIHSLLHIPTGKRKLIEHCFSGSYKVLLARPSLLMIEGNAVSLAWGGDSTSPKPPEKF